LFLSFLMEQSRFISRYHVCTLIDLNYKISWWSSLSNVQQEFFCFEKKLSYFYKIKPNLSVNVLFKHLIFILLLRVPGYSHEFKF
jgi:hypothetical protein